MKKKIYVLTTSKVFMKGHPRAGETTNFREKILSGDKLHTIRGNYDSWKSRIDEVNEGKAVLSLRYWDGRPYKDKQKEIQLFDNYNGIGIQRLDSMDFNSGTCIIEETETEFIPGYLDVLADNDGLNLQDFKDWFSKPKTYPMAIIHFTDFRYE